MKGAQGDGGDGGHAKPRSTDPFSFCLGFGAFFLFVGLHFHWLKGRVRTAWAVFQDGFSDVFETIIVSHFLCLHCLLQLPNAETLCSVWT